MARISRDLLSQARILATREPRKPKQATLRRSISTSYYALYHFLCEESALLLVGAAHGDVPLRHLAARGFVHGKMKSLCKEFLKLNQQQVHELLQPFWTPLNVPGNADVQLVAQTFIDLQDERHEADYNVAAVFSRQDALNAHARVEAAFNAWKNAKVNNREVCRLLSLAMILWPTLAAR